MTLVVKIGGGAGIDPENVLSDLSHRKDWVLVHGSSDEATRVGQRMGIAPRFVTSVTGQPSRFTDEATLEAVIAAAALVNTRLVTRLQVLGAKAVGLAGVDGSVLAGARKSHVKALVDGKRVVLRGDNTGTVDEVNADLLRLLLQGGYAPVVGLPVFGRDEEGAGPVNADADRAAAAVARALGADTLVILSNVPGLLRDPADPSTLVSRIPFADLANLAEKYAQGRFKKKVMGATEALSGGVARVILADARAPQPIERALRGEGTVIERNLKVSA
ncbi:MAG: [LysW]-aminoadipate kinase [Thermoplasmatota archaeon]